MPNVPSQSSILARGMQHIRRPTCSNINSPSPGSSTHNPPRFPPISRRCHI